MRSNENRLVRSSLVLFGAIALLGSACVVAARPPPPPPPRILSAPEAVAIATQYARSRGVVVDYTVAARLDRVARWHVDLGGVGGRDGARVVLDGYSGRILRARLRAAGADIVQQPQAGPGPAPAPPMPPGSGVAPAPPPAGQPAPAPEPDDVMPPPGTSPPEAPPPPPPAVPPPPPDAGNR